MSSSTREVHKPLAEPGGPGPDGSDASGAGVAGFRRLGSGRAGVIAAAVALALCGGGFALYGILGGDDEKPRRSVPTASVTYEVTGEGRVDLSYQGASENGRARTVSGARLPWRTTVQIPLGQDPVVSITLGEHGSRATCTLAISGRHVQSATADGGFGRATCSGTLPSPRPTDG
ncbi:hypothetical protein [Streptomyces sp. NBC_01217]|uniref:hypothetical protein n=1 Tax=Streptomyces sp. NBC_01217 TaxID=2903779 RepID=UPI002E0ED83B|nr:hypothetical protein OG507_05495 [Streptomyces sp. NBC_01217]